MKKMNYNVGFVKFAPGGASGAKRQDRTFISQKKKDILHALPFVGTDSEVPPFILGFCAGNCCP